MLRKCDQAAKGKAKNSLNYQTTNKDKEADLTERKKKNFRPILAITLWFIQKIKKLEPLRDQMTNAIKDNCSNGVE